MSSPIPSPACRPIRHLVPISSSSRIGHRMIPPCNPSQTIPDTTTSRFRSVPLPALISSPHFFPPRFPPHRVAPRVGLRHDAILHATRIDLSRLFTVSLHLIGSSPVPSCFPPSVQPHLVPLDCSPCVPLRLVPFHRLISPARCLPHLVHLIGSLAHRPHLIPSPIR